MSETLIKVEGLSKKFTRDLKRGLLYGTADTARSMLGINYKTDYLRKKEFWALQDINFELKRGEVLGLIGRNGCGKSTLLRLLTGIFPPDKGKITMKGRVGALIAVGAGFHPHMSGRENVYLNGTLLGMNRHEIKKRFEEIVEFAEIGEFIDAPVATYSSGMRVRLGFAIAVHVEPDILLIDEVLSVGDQNFKIKSLNKITDLLESTAVIFVSHTMPQISRISTQIILMKNSVIVEKSNNINEVISRYLQNLTTLNQSSLGIVFQNFKISCNKIVGTEFNIQYSESIIFTLNFETKMDIHNSFITLNFVNSEFKTFAIAVSNSIKLMKNHRVNIICDIGNIYFAPGVYHLNITVNEKINNTNESRVTHDVIRNAAKINIESKKNIYNTYVDIYLKSVWKVQ